MFCPGFKKKRGISGILQIHAENKKSQKNRLLSGF
jgi:hypothetical protein